MSWGSWSAFFAMGGAALYVWGAYGIVALALLAELMALRARDRRARQMTAGASAAMPGGPGTTGCETGDAARAQTPPANVDEAAAMPGQRSRSS